MSLIKETEDYLKRIIIDLGYEIDNVSLIKTSRPDLGQFQINEAFVLGKKYHKKPREIGEEIVAKLDNRFKNVNIAGAGFINLTFCDDILCDYLNKGLKNFDIFVDKHEKKKIIVDYGGANAAKALHVGHMRSANIGEAIKRLAKLLGDDVIGDVHLGDLGRQAGMLISEYKRMKPDSPFFDPNYQGDYPKIDLTSKDLGIMYPKASMEAKNDEKRMEEVREITAMIDKGHAAYIALWKQMVAISSIKIKEVYDKLNCHFELWEGELAAFQYIPNVLSIMKPYLYESEGALVCDVSNSMDNKPMPPLMVIKKDGSTIYGTRDLGTIYSRMKRFHPDEIWYFTDERQSLYFEQVFRASYKTGLVKENTLLKHFGFGTVNGKDGKPYKTRDGGVMELEDLINLIYQETYKNIKEEIVEPEREEIANKLSIAALKYADLLPYRKTDYIFDPEKFSSLEGKTGPYVLYTLVRIKAVLKKAIDQDYQLFSVDNLDVLGILIKLLEVNGILNKSYNEVTLNYITEYIYELLSLYNRFYNNNSILNEKNDNVRKTYLALSQLVYNIVHNLLDVLAIEEVDRM